MSILLEIAANSLQSCLSAQKGGADRIELFENLPEGGCTPSYGMLTWVKEHINIPVYVMIRPRGGDFLYTNEEFEVMCRDIDLCQKLGFPGVVFGLLDTQGDIDIARCRELLSLCGDMKVTFHRAFDRSRDLSKSLQQLIDLGFDRVLTSGGEVNVDEGKEAVRQLQQQYGNEIIVMPGCGVSSANARAIVDYCGVREIHATAKTTVLSGSLFQKLPFTDGRQESSEDEVRAIVRVLQNDLL